MGSGLIFQTKNESKLLNLCKACNKHFKPKSNWRYINYCSHHCVETTRKSKTYICKRCGELIEAPKARILCHKCRGVRRIVCCDFCGNRIKIGKPRGKFKHHFCSKSCYLKSIGQKAKIVACVQCGKDVRLTFKRQNVKNPTCSRACRYQWNRGANNYGWVGGSLNYRGEDWSLARKQRVHKDNSLCVLSGRHLDSSNVDVHHIIPYRIIRRHDSWNLISLDRPLHKRLDLLSKSVAQLLEQRGFSMGQAWKLVLVFVINAIVRKKLTSQFFTRMLYDPRPRAANKIANFLIREVDKSKQAFLAAPKI